MPSNEEKWKISFFSVLIFLLVVNPYTYKLVQKLLGPIVGKIADETTGCPTTLGLFVHSVVFLLIVRGSMEYKII